MDAELSSFGFGDLRITPKVALLRGGLDLALAVAVTAPTGGAEDYRGDDGLTFTPTLLIGGHAGRLRLGLNLGYRVRAPSSRSISRSTTSWWPGPAWRCAPARSS